MYRLTTMSECVYITQMIIPEQCVVVDVVMKRRKACYGMKLDLKNGGHPSTLVSMSHHGKRHGRPIYIPLWLVFSLKRFCRKQAKSQSHRTVEAFN